MSDTIAEARSAGKTEAGYTEEALERIRTQAGTVADAEFPSVAAAAKDAGVAYSTFAAFLKGSYAGNNDKVAAEVEIWLSARAERRQTAAALPRSPVFQTTPTAQHILSILEFCQTAADFGVVVGGAGIGKTTSLKHYQQTHPNVWLATMDETTSSVNGMLREIVETMGLAERSNSEFSRALKRRMAGTNGLLIVDEAQHLIPQALNQLRSLHDRAGIGVVVAGNEEIYSRIDGGKSRFAQLASRVGMRMSQPKPQAQDVCMLVKAWSVVDPNEIKYLKAVGNKPGALRTLDKVMKLAGMLALGANEPRSLKHLRAAYEQRQSGDKIAEAA